LGPVQEAIPRLYCATSCAKRPQKITKRLNFNAYASASSGGIAGVPTNGAFILASFLAWFTDPTAPEA
jgi:hypothetical protein